MRGAEGRRPAAGGEDTKQVTEGPAGTPEKKATLASCSDRRLAAGKCQFEEWKPR